MKSSSRLKLHIELDTRKTLTIYEGITNTSFDMEPISYVHVNTKNTAVRRIRTKIKQTKGLGTCKQTEIFRK